MTTTPKAPKRAAGKTFLGGYIASLLVEQVQQVADREFRKNRTWAFEELLKQGLAHHRKNGKAA